MSRRVMSVRRPGTRLLLVGAAVLGFCLGVVVGALWVTRFEQGWVESVGTLAAAVVAAFAAITAIVIATQDRQHAAEQAARDRAQALALSEVEQVRARYRTMQDLLGAFVRYAGVRWVEVGQESDGDKWRAAAAAFTGQLRACAEPLPRSKTLMFDHLEPTEDELEAWLAG